MGRVADAAFGSTRLRGPVSSLRSRALCRSLLLGIMVANGRGLVGGAPHVTVLDLATSTRVVFATSNGVNLAPPSTMRAPQSTTSRSIWRRLVPERGQVARPASTRVNALRTIMQSLSMKAFFLVFWPALLYGAEGRLGLDAWRFTSSLWKGAAIALFLCGSALAESSACFLVARGEGTPLPTSCPARLVIAGPYRYLRNPMATGSLMQGVAIGLWLGSPLVLLYVAIGMAAWNFLARPWEERDLEARFGPAYARYRATVRCWIPRLRPYSS